MKENQTGNNSDSNNSEKPTSNPKAKRSILRTIHQAVIGISGTILVLGSGYMIYQSFHDRTGALSVVLSPDSNLVPEAIPTPGVYISSPTFEQKVAGVHDKYISQFEFELIEDNPKGYQGRLKYFTHLRPQTPSELEAPIYKAAELMCPAELNYPQENVPFAQRLAILDSIDCHPYISARSFKAGSTTVVEWPKG